jgi:hypothetical protein
VTANADPWRTLGLTPGASPDEIRQAYRRLAKTNHPDAAGEAALPRFLAIQAAYEQLAGPGRTRRVGSRPAAEPGVDRREPWRADPNRARASERADGRRTPGARPAGAGPRTRAQDPGFASGSSGTKDGTDRPSGAGSTKTGEGTGAGRARRASSRERPATTATPGSTSYEGADKEPFEPGWTGATWYGASSGTYWTINPKEYADPRKHGPEYQARARRSRSGWILEEDGRPTGARTESPPDDESATTREEAAADAAGAGAGPDGRAPTGQPMPEPDAEPEPEADGEPFALGRSRRSPGGRRHWTDGSAPSTAGGAERMPGDGRTRAGHGAADTAARATATGGTPPDGSPPKGVRSWIDASGEAAGDALPFLRRPTTPTGRLAMALVGWPPLGVFAAAAIDRSTGCGTYAASCPEASSPGTWILEAAILLLLLALPAVATWSAHGSVAALVVGVPAAVLLSAAGGTNVREMSGPILLGVLALAYLGGVVYAVVARRRPRPL